MTTSRRRKATPAPVTIRIDPPPGRLGPVMRDSLYLFRYIAGDDRAASGDKALKALLRLSQRAALSQP